MDRYVVLDEAHIYCGAFGANVACILRRLLRICNRNAQFICCSATLANPAEHFRNLVPDLHKRPLCVVSENGAPSAPRLLTMWEPPHAATNFFMDKSQEQKVKEALADVAEETDLSVAADDHSFKRRSAILETALLMSALVKQGVRTLVFCSYRKLVELVIMWVKEDLKDTAPELMPLVKSYRSGYNQEERRAIEQGLFDGTLLGVVATNALELGVDIGGLDATVTLGFPPSISSLWQQLGRAGRGMNPALNIVCLWSSPLDQYYAHHPDKLFLARRAENAVVDASSSRVLREHVVCAAAEIPLDLASAAKIFGDGCLDQVIELVRAQVLLRDPSNRNLYVSNPAMEWPARHVNLRSIEQVIIVFAVVSLVVIQDAEIHFCATRVFGQDHR